MTTTPAPARHGVWADLVGQHRVTGTLAAAASGKGMTHAFLFTGPPGSGRSNAAMAFAAALQCERGPGREAGCGQCQACRTVLAGSHPDVTRVRTDSVQFLVRDARDMVRKAAMSPVTGRWQVIVVEDADRFNESSGNAVLKAVEEPGPRTVWLLCAPTVEDVLPTIRSRCRLVTLATPSAPEVAEFLVRTAGVSDGLAAYAARASQGHIGRAKALALDEATRNRRREVVKYPRRLTGIGAAMTAAANLAEVAKEEADAITSEQDAREKADLDQAFGYEDKGRRPREYASALKDMTENQKRRARRRVLDVVDRSLMDLVSVYRDAIALAVGAPGALVNEEIRDEIEEVVRASTPELNLQRIEWVFAAREQMMEFNVPPALALESMMVALRVPEALR
ncbi:DNA polymerase III subunit delta' [Nocardioides bruguierae]|uniref:DNA polymerase III subunit delta n=1 Tax=Nocardioides bruguierae TaxID=2945102 RepID=A0A9X2DBA6_9ACTN|nr:DNA polymerase III subunit delta' [Nocardioides bruguierae]MCM0622668.1 DNA polymerase III subunit delta' [Nocardioides bruguierae]